jgi:hypothetical protein
MEKEACELLTRARRLATRRKLHVDNIVCPIEKTCDGDNCAFFTKFDRNIGIIYQSGKKDDRGNKLEPDR